MKKYMKNYFSLYVVPISGGGMMLTQRDCVVDVHETLHVHTVPTLEMWVFMAGNFCIHYGNKNYVHVHVVTSSIQGIEDLSELY